MHQSRQFPRSLHQRRPRRIQQLIPHRKHPPLPYRRHISPSLHLIRLPWIRFVASRRPRQHDHFRPRLRHLRVSHLFSRRNNHLPAANLHHLRHPRRRTNPRIRPSLAIHAHPPLQFLRRARNRGKLRPHLPNQRLRLRCPPRNSSQQPNISINILDRPWIHRQKIQPLLQQFPNSFRLVWHRPNHQRWPPRHNRTQNRSSAGRQRHNPHLRFFLRGHESSVTECIALVYPAPHPSGTAISGCPS